ncbi:MAG: hypothetical protein RPR97_05835 [Colwellia sp.]
MELTGIPSEPIALLLGLIAIYQSLFAKHNKIIINISAISFFIFLLTALHAEHGNPKDIDLIQGIIGGSFAIFLTTVFTWIVIDIIKSKRFSK